MKIKQIKTNNLINGLILKIEILIFMEILSVNGFIECSTNILGHSGSILYCVSFFIAG